MAKKFRKKPVIIEAGQYLKGKNIPKGAKVKYPEVVFSHDGKLYYLTHTNSWNWLSVEPREDGTYECYPFSLYDIKNGDRKPADENIELVDRYVKQFNVEAPSEYVWVVTIHNGQSVKLENGDWVLPEPDGEHYYPCKPDIFEATYESVED